MSNRPLTAPEAEAMFAATDEARADAAREASGRSTEPPPDAVPHVQFLGQWLTGDVGEQKVTLLRADEAGAPVLRIEVSVDDPEAFTDRFDTHVDLVDDVATATALALFPVLDSTLRSTPMTATLLARRLAFLEVAKSALHAALEGDDVPDHEEEPF